MRDEGSELDAEPAGLKDFCSMSRNRFEYVRAHVCAAIRTMLSAIAIERVYKAFTVAEAGAVAARVGGKSRARICVDRLVDEVGRLHGVDLHLVAGEPPVIAADKRLGREEERIGSLLLGGRRGSIFCRIIVHRVGSHRVHRLIVHGEDQGAEAEPLAMADDRTAIVQRRPVLATGGVGEGEEDRSFARVGYPYA